jgi:hypothetical protein
MTREHRAVIADCAGAMKRNVEAYGSGEQILAGWPAALREHAVERREMPSSSGAGWRCFARSSERALAARRWRACVSCRMAICLSRGTSPSA